MSTSDQVESVMSQLDFLALGTKLQELKEIQEAFAKVQTVADMSAVTTSQQEIAVLTDQIRRLERGLIARSPEMNEVVKQIASRHSSAQLALEQWQRSTKAAIDLAEHSNVARELSKLSSLTEEMSKQRSAAQELAKQFSAAQELSKHSRLAAEVAKHADLAQELAKQSKLADEFHKQSSLIEQIKKLTGR